MLKGYCGSCWAFSAVGVLEGLNFNHSGHLVSLSEQNLVDCSTSKYGNEGCDGGLPASAIKYVIDNNGIDGEDDYPYEGVEGTCRYSRLYSKATASGIVRLPYGDEKKLAEAVATVGPISVGIDASGISTYKSGVYAPKHCSHRPNHAVLIVGYDGTKKRIPYWLIKNSWGTSWGDNGYMKLIRNNHNTCGVATMAVYATLH
ncbi:unnamed protein product [Thelazia callipaeda]|uniref:Peptidase C1A papain C-terminal domain-containing protein n=1 Tax=Thelazia callipaeda TaxID=103827 RepID=A0A3P7MPR6_THECL|nr:unnamed protein product [Thelazia callipaeda]